LSTAITGLTYDNAGNLTNEGTGGHSHTFSAENQITQMDGGGAGFRHDQDTSESEPSSFHFGALHVDTSIDLERFQFIHPGLSRLYFIEPPLLEPRTSLYAYVSF